jgi:FkbM family methyltransferase
MRGGIVRSLRIALRKSLYTRCPGIAGSFPYYGTWVYFPKHSVIFDMLMRDGAYEQANVALLQSLVKPDTHFFDIGANIGLMSIAVLHGTASCRVVSFEPAPSAFSFLTRTAARSRYRDRWTVLSHALGSHVGSSGFFTSNAGDDAYGGFKDTKRGDTDLQIEVPVSTVDAQWLALGKPNVSVIKIDVEGAELEVVQGATQIIAAQRPCLLLEWNARNLEPYRTPAERLLELAESLDYKIFSVAAHPSPRPADSLTPVPDRLTLMQQMVATESFLLAPGAHTALSGL